MTRPPPLPEDVKVLNTPNKGVENENILSPQYNMRSMTQNKCQVNKLHNENLLKMKNYYKCTQIKCIYALIKNCRN